MHYLSLWVLVLAAGGGTCTSPVEEEFYRAHKYVNESLPRTSEFRPIRITLFGLFMQGTEGPCTVAKPGHVPKSYSRAMWKAWKELGDMPTGTAQSEYVSLLNEIVPDWRVTS